MDNIASLQGQTKITSCFTSSSFDSFQCYKFSFSDIDCVTPLCSQLAYEGLLADVFGISSGLYQYVLIHFATSFKEVLLLFWMRMCCCQGSSKDLSYISC